MRSRMTAALAGPVAGAVSAGASITRRPGVAVRVATVDARGGRTAPGAA